MSVSEEDAICVSCGTCFPVGMMPEHCPICLDERQFLPVAGQRWTDLSTIKRSYRIDWKPVQHRVHALCIAPQFGIGQRALLIQTDAGNILWDCLPFLDTETLTRLNVLGGVSAIAISHPHFYGSHAHWSRALGGIPVFVHSDDREWMVMPHADVEFWSGARVEPLPGFTMIRCGGHFAGSAVLHWQNGDGVLFTGDTVQVVADRAHVSFMRSFPNLIPLDARSVRTIGQVLEPFAYDCIHGGFPGASIVSNAKSATRRSVDRYIRAVEGRGIHPLE